VPKSPIWGPRQDPDPSARGVLHQPLAEGSESRESPKWGFWTFPGSPGAPWGLAQGPKRASRALPEPRRGLGPGPRSRPGEGFTSTPRAGAPRFPGTPVPGSRGYPRPVGALGMRPEL